MSTIMLYVGKMKKVIIWLMPLIMITCGVWYLLPDHVLMATPLNEGKSNSQRLTAGKFTSMEPRAIPALIKEIKTRPIGDRCFMHYSNALASFGRISKDALLKEIDGNNHPREQFKLIIALQKGFNDYSRLFLWINRAVCGNYNFLQLAFMSNAVSKAYIGAPALRDPKKHKSLNPKFQEWWMVRNVAVNTSLLVPR